VTSLLAQVVVNGLLLGATYALVAIGLTLIFGVVRIVNFAQGEFVMIGMYLAFWIFAFHAVDPYIAVFVVTPIVFLLGVLVHRGIIRPFFDAPSNSLILVTFGLSIILQNGALLAWKSDPRAAETAYSNAAFLVGDVSVSVPRLVILAVTLAIVAGLHLVLAYTYWGMAMAAVAQDRRAATLMGVNIHRVYMLAFGLGVALEGLAGALLIPIYPVTPTTGGTFTIVAFVVVVLGGMGNVLGALLAGLIVGLVEAFSGFFISPQLQGALYYLIFVGILVARPQGLLGVVGAQEVGFR
jgi:branched-chain amino acid transport system permease protein